LTQAAQRRTTTYEPHSQLPVPISWLNSIYRWQKGYAGGTDLSGAQWQRVALAGALCAVRRGAGLVLLDEPTAQLGVRGEAEVFDRLLTATQEVTTILSSIALQVRHADRSVCSHSSCKLRA
jgi:ABC-type transport system involved in cytochrome bd biosynthesis fused ATPase/permease subunit